MYFANGVKATRWSQSPFANVQFDRGETEWISNENSKRMFQNMVDGTMEGIGNKTVIISEKIKGLQSGRLQDYAMFFVSGVVIIALVFIYLWTN